MTCVVSFCSSGSVFLAGDSYLENESGISEQCVGSKVFRIGERLGVGVCGSVRCEQAFLQLLREAAPRQPTAKWVQQKLPQIAHEALQELLQPSEAGLVLPSGTTFLIAVEGLCFVLEDDFGIWSSQRPYNAIGAGASVAKGAFEALMEFDLSPVDRINRVLRVSEKLCNQVRAPFSAVRIDFRPESKTRK